MGSVKIQFDDGSTDYPMDVSKAFTILAESENTGNTVYNKIVVDVSAYAYAGLFRCGWTYLPTFGLLNNIHKCANCPIQPGKISLKQYVDIAKYAPIVSLLGGGRTYQLEIRIKDDNDNSNSGAEEIACVVVQAAVKKS